MSKNNSSERDRILKSFIARKYKFYSESNEAFNWIWEGEPGNSDSVQPHSHKKVNIYALYNLSTSVVRSSRTMSVDQHYWEIAIRSQIYETDVMIGIGTTDTSLVQLRDTHKCVLGMDSNTWGLSHTGMFQHNGKQRMFCSRFGHGSVLGVHLDMWNGTMSFYHNHKFLGIAARGLQGKALHAMASSAAARSVIQLKSSSTFPSSLQYLCCLRLRQLVPPDKHVLHSLHFPPSLRSLLSSSLGWLLKPQRPFRISRQSLHLANKVVKAQRKRRRVPSTEGMGDPEYFPPHRSSDSSSSSNSSSSSSSISADSEANNNRGATDSENGGSRETGHQILYPRHLRERQIRRTLFARRNRKLSIRRARRKIERQRKSKTDQRWSCHLSDGNRLRLQLQSDTRRDSEPGTSRRDYTASGSGSQTRPSSTLNRYQTDQTLELYCSNSSSPDGENCYSASDESTVLKS